jgi:phosphate acetyltransferase
MDFLSSLKEKAKKLNKRIVFPESNEKRILKAVEVILNEHIAVPVLLGKRDELEKEAHEQELKINFDEAVIIDNKDEKIIEKYASELAKIRSEKGLTLDQAKKLLEDINYFGTMVVQMEDADGMISGTLGTTAETIRPALQIIKTKEKFHKVSGFFFMILEERLLLFADCAININPNSHDLADIAIDTAETAKRFGIEPHVALLSFSTNGSAKDPSVDKVREATALAKDKEPDLIIDGEMQVDCALVPAVAKKKFPNSAIQGDANVLIFPNLEAGNIAYKLVERLAGAKAVGPILQGLRQPVNDLSRGCSYQDIVDLAAFTACEAQEMEFEEFHGGRLPSELRKY